MVQTLLATSVLRELREDFGLTRVEDEQFFREWQDDLPELSDAERQNLDKIRAGFLNLLEYPPLLEKTIQISILGPLFFSGGFYLPPFHIETEQSTEIETEDNGVIIRGQLDIVLLKEQFWVMVIESKRFSYSLAAGEAKLLAYMLANPHPQKPGFGMLCNGSDFRFIKVSTGQTCRYATSKQFNLLDPGNALYDVLRIMKRIGQL